MENEELVEGRDPATAEPTNESGIDEELLIEEISIDGMCGVY
jgi:mycofactocin precursor